MLIPVSIEALLLGAAPDKSVVVLRPFVDADAEPRVLPIYIGMPEALAISLAIEGKSKERPQTHDLTLDAIDALGGKITGMVIDRVDGLTFFARLIVEQDGTVYEIDARPSDALALSLRAKAPMYVESPVFIAASIPFNAQHDDIREREIEAFHEYIENIDPEDFKR
ncbi:MAG: bifunctional nuclease family protein [Coriobacteriales bacterium]|jgi:bifunctional DNase/RNase